MVPAPVHPARQLYTLADVTAAQLARCVCPVRVAAPTPVRVLVARIFPVQGSPFAALTVLFILSSKYRLDSGTKHGFHRHKTGVNEGGALIDVMPV